MPIEYICDTKECKHKSKDIMEAYEHHKSSGHATFRQRQTFTKKEDEQLKQDYIKKLRHR